PLDRLRADAEDAAALDSLSRPVDARVDDGAVDEVLDDAPHAGVAAEPVVETRGLVGRRLVGALGRVAADLLGRRHALLGALVGLAVAGRVELLGLGRLLGRAAGRRDRDGGGESEDE